jgi:phosphoglucosamine mutase
VGKLFGTDGVRGVANSELTPELALRLGRAAATVLRRSERGRILIARDTRASGTLLEAALSAGIQSAGVDVVYCGVLPTPAVAFLVTDVSADAGAMISASHNPAEDNGIKFFGADGYKLSDATEAEIEAGVDAQAQAVTGAGVGRAEALVDADSRYVAHALGALEGRSLGGLRVVLDCANGAAFRASPAALRKAGAEVIVVGGEPDGMNINVDCGSTHPEMLAGAVVEHRAHAGLAHDGDADRLIAVDEAGKVVDGDAIIAALAVELQEQKGLTGDLVVGTVMCNLGFRKAMDGRGIKLIETPVGDRYVIEAMREHGAVIGGEQSGHVIFADHSTTGDGLITGLRLLARMASSGKPLSELASIVEKFPQVLVNVAVERPGRVGDCLPVWEVVAKEEAGLDGDGRILVRASGTEPVVRVMVEASDESSAGSAAGRIAAVIEKEMS